MKKMCLATMIMMAVTNWSVTQGDCGGCMAGGACCADREFALEYGICTRPEQSGKMKAAGYDYLEAGVRWFLIPDQSDEAFLKQYLEMLKTLELEVRACNSFLPGSLKSTGPDADHEAVLAWAETAFRRAKLVGIKVIVFGSGASRRIPDGFSRERAREQFVALLKKMGPIAQRYGVVVVIEPLNSKECNFINTVSEATDIARAVNHPHIRVLADFYHMLKEDEGPESLVKAGRLLYHCHIAEEENRMAPGTHGEDFTAYFAALKQIGYRGRLSIEGRWKDFDADLVRALQTMTRQARQAQPAGATSKDR